MGEYEELSREELITKLEEYDYLFELQRKRVIRADELYCREFNTNIYPDLGKLVGWLLKKAGY